ncbi:hypothetical protein F5Y06DRAFT_272778 [Hypoxylon sp. FL0890]|nr:hypothetical protein F5Y06DRAFT_272778 [Hypoxylon sp. FL0890]
MPAIMDDPASPTIYRVSGQPPFPDPNKPELPPNVLPRQVTLRDRQTIATVVPFASRDQVPASLLAYLSDQFAKEIEGGDTYPMIDPMPLEKFSAYWFQNFAGIMLLGQIESAEDVVEGKDWSRECLGSFYIKPNYPGRSSHVCNGGFLVTDASRNRGVGRLMGESYLDWAPKLGYTYSVFNLVYETNVASCKIWDALGFKRIGRVKGCGNLKSYPDRLIDAIIYGRDLGPGAGEGNGEPLLVSEERFDKIKFYLKYGRYPNGSDRSMKARLRSAATHYKLLDNDVLMLKDKEVISDPVRQTDISRRLHEAGGHAGINKTTATIAEKYHWSRIKETVSDVIRTCDQCKETGKTPSLQNSNNSRRLNVNSNCTPTGVSPMPSRMSPLAAPEPGSLDATGRVLELQESAPNDLPPLVGHPNPYAHPSDITSLLNPPMQAPPDTGLPPHHPLMQSQLHHDSAATLASLHEAVDLYHPIDPQIISQSTHHHQPTAHHHHPHAFNSFHPSGTVPNSSPHPSHTSLSGQETYSPHETHVTIHTFQTQPHHHQGPPQHDPDSFQALLQDTDSVDGESLPSVSESQLHARHHPHHSLHSEHDHPEDATDHDQDAVDRDLDMLIDSEMDIDEVVIHNHGHDADSDIDTRRMDEESAVRDRSGVDAIEESIIAGETSSAAAAKRSSIYNVVFNPST